MRPDAAQAITTSELPGGTGLLGPVRTGTGRARLRRLNEPQRGVYRRCKQGGTVECNI